MTLGDQMSMMLNLPVSYADERYTSGEADRRLRETQGAGKKFNAKKIAQRDSVAAHQILETQFSQTCTNPIAGTKVKQQEYRLTFT